MAIAGLLVHTLAEALPEVEARIRRMPEMTLYGCHQDQYIVVVADAPSERMEEAVERIHAIDGVLTVYTTYVTIEDELEHWDGALPPAGPR